MTPPNDKMGVGEEAQFGRGAQGGHGEISRSESGSNQAPNGKDQQQRRSCGIIRTLVEQPLTKVLKVGVDLAPKWDQISLLRCDI